MIKSTLILFLLSLHLFTHAQNLIPNGDFEIGPEYTSIGWALHLKPLCNLQDSIPGPDFWKKTTGSPDRIINDQIYCNWDIDTAKSGTSYIVVAPFEGGKTELTSSLETNSTYRLSCYLKIETFSGSLNDTNRVGFILDDIDSIISPEITNSLEWLFFDTTFVSTTNSSELEILGLGDFFFSSGIKVDDISLTKIEPSNIETKDILEEKITIYPNPFKNHLYFTLENNDHSEITIYDVHSRKIFYDFFRKSISIDTHEFPKGNYYYILTNQQGIRKNGIIIKE